MTDRNIDADKHARDAYAFARGALAMPGRLEHWSELTPAQQALYRIVWAQGAAFAFHACGQNVTLHEGESCPRY